MTECWVATDFAARAGTSYQTSDAVMLFDSLGELQGEVFREVDARRTLKVSMGDEPYFLKIHFGVGWLEIIKNLVQFRLPVLGARNEWVAIRRLDQAGVATMTPVVFVEYGVNPAQQCSAIVTEALEDRTSLEFYDPPDALEKRELLQLIGTISRRMHLAGVNHRDYYLCHFLMSKTDHKDLRLIDLHRAQVRARVPVRWLVKDLGGLLFSALDKGLTRRDLLRFLTVYRQQPLRDILRTERRFWNRVLSRARRLYQQDHGMLPPHAQALLKPL